MIPSYICSLHLEFKAIKPGSKVVHLLFQATKLSSFNSNNYVVTNNTPLPHKSPLRILGLRNTFIHGGWWVENILGIRKGRKVPVKETQIVTLSLPQPESLTLDNFTLFQMSVHFLQLENLLPSSSPWIKIIKMFGDHRNPTKTLILLKANQNITLYCREIQWVNEVKWIKLHCLLNIILLKNFQWLAFISTPWPGNQGLTG